jgi:SAM-dependent methyltransferase
MIGSMSTERSPHWEPIARDFELHAATSAFNALYDRPTVLDLCGDVRGLHVLDVGCGPGFYAQELLARGAVGVTGVDASATMVELARQRVPDHGTFRVHDLETPLDWLADGVFDLAVMALVIHHLDERTGALREIHRVLRGHGRLVVSTHHPTADWMTHGGSYFDTTLIEETWSNGWRVRYWRMPLSQVAMEFYEAGFVIERLVEAQPDEAMATRHPDEYDQLRKEPGFIAFRLAKQTSDG